jgi:hypothetical protein
MTKKTAAPELSVEVERPAAGGSYERQADGSLKRIEFTDAARVAADQPADGNDQAEG